MKYHRHLPAAMWPCLLLLVIGLIPGSGRAQGHFIFKANTGDSYAIVVESAELNNIPLQNGDEIGVFTPGGLCVGASVVQGISNTLIAAWQDDSITLAIDGYHDGEAITFRVWDVSNQAEFVLNPDYVLGNGTFGNGPYSQVSLSLQINFAPRLSFANAYRFDEDTVLELHLDEFVTDEDHADDVLTWQITGGQEIAATMLPNHVARFTPAPNWFGVEIFTFIVSDPLGASDTAQVRLEVLAVNDQPSAVQLLSPIGDAHVDTAHVVLQWQAATDVDGDALSYLVIYGTDRTLTAPADSGRTTATSFAIPDNRIKPRQHYFWRVLTSDGLSPAVASAIDSFLTLPPTSVAGALGGPQDFDLAQNYPNPFSLQAGTTTIRFSLPQPAFVSLDIHNALGQKIASVVQSTLPAGQHQYAWQGVDDTGRRISSGIYWINLRAGEFQALRKMIVVK